MTEPRIWAVTPAMPPIASAMIGKVIDDSQPVGDSENWV